MAKAILFDMDGVLINSEPLWRESKKLLLGRYGLEHLSHLKSGTMGMTNLEAMRKIMEDTGLRGDVAALTDERASIVISLAGQKLELFEGVREKVAEARERGMKTAVATASPKRILDWVLDRFEMQNMFDGYANGDGGIKGKPNPDIFLTAAKAIGVAPENCVVIEDAPHGIEAAKRAGMKCIAVTNSYPKEKLPEAGLIVSGMKDISIEELLGW